MSVAHALILSILQGAFELFPVSSLGHTVIVPALFGWSEKQSTPSFLAFVVVLHLGTACALLLFFWRDWLRIIRAVLRSVARRELSSDPDERLGWLLIAGTVPAGVLGVFFQTALTKLFGAPGLVAVFLFVNGALLLVGERMRQRSKEPVLPRGTGDGQPELRRQHTALAALSFPAALGVGTAQALALLPGFSRSGASMVGGLRAGLTHVEAGRFAFLLATPLILGAGIVTVPDLFKRDASVGPGVAVLGFVVSGLTAFLAVRFLMRYLETERLDVFGYYCLGFGALAFVALALQGRL